MQNVSEFDDVVASFALTPLSIDTMKFESSVLGTFLDSDVDNEVVAINVQIETIMSLKLFTIFIQRQQNEVRCLNHCRDHRCQPFLHNCAKKSLWNDYLKHNLLWGKDFSLMFCICSRFEKLMQDIMETSIPFFSDVFCRN